jgi:hypothetical protein
VRLPKRYLTDPGLLGPLLRIDQRRVLRDGDLLGRALDTLAAARYGPNAPPASLALICSTIATRTAGTRSTCSSKPETAK